MAIQGEEKGTYYLVHVGKKFNTKNLVQVKRTVEEALWAGHSTVIFDMSECIEIDSSALGLSANLSKKCRDSGGKAGFLCPSNEIKDILGYANIENAITIYNSEDEID